MIIRQLKATEYEKLQGDLLQRAHLEPHSASCTVTMTIDGAEYALRLQPERHRRLAVLQALRIRRDSGSPAFELIIKGALLASLLELLLYQGVA